MTMYVWDVEWTNKLNWRDNRTVIAPDAVSAIQLAQMPEQWVKGRGAEGAMVAKVERCGFVDAIWPHQPTVEELAAAEVEKMLA